MSENIFRLVLLPCGATQPVRLNSLHEAMVWVQEEYEHWVSLSQDGVLEVSTDIERCLRKVKRELSVLASRETQFDREQSENIAANAMMLHKYSKEDIENLHNSAQRALRTLEQPPYLTPSAIYEAFGSIDLVKQAAYDGLMRTTKIIYSIWAGNDQSFDFKSPIYIAAVLRSAALWGNVNKSTQKDGVLDQLSPERIPTDHYFSSLDEILGDGREKLRGLAAISEMLTRQWGEREEALRAQGVERQYALGKLETTYRDVLDGVKIEFSDKLETLYKNSAERFKSIELAYTEERYMREPASHWEKKRQNHQKYAKRWLYALAILTFVGISGGVWADFYILDWMANRTFGAAALILLALPAGLYITIVRIAHRSYRDQTKHADDADQRATLARTYLALVGDNSMGVSSGERLLALHALFRGAALGESPDDTPPVNALEALLQALKPKATS